MLDISCEAAAAAPHLSPVSTSRAALLLIEWTELGIPSSTSRPLGSWIWSGDPADAAPVAFAVITHPDLVGFFARGGFLLQVGHRVVTQIKQWEDISDDIQAIWSIIGSGVLTTSKKRAKAKTLNPDRRELSLPRKQGDIGYQMRAFSWERPGGKNPGISVLKSAVDVATNTQPENVLNVRQEPAPHVLELHTQAYPAGARTRDEPTILKRIHELLTKVTAGAEHRRQTDPFGKLEDRVQVAMLHLYRANAFTTNKAVSAPTIVRAISPDRARVGPNGIEVRANQLTRSIKPHQASWFGSVRGAGGGYYLTAKGKRFVSAAIKRLELNSPTLQWPG